MDWSSFSNLKASVGLLKQKLTFPGDPMLLGEPLGPHLVDLIERLVYMKGCCLIRRRQDVILQ
jgi:hypothetical protein